LRISVAINRCVIQDESDGLTIVVGHHRDEQTQLCTETHPVCTTREATEVAPGDDRKQQEETSRASRVTSLGARLRKMCLSTTIVTGGPLVSRGTVLEARRRRGILLWQMPFSM
jgi:hypothetical protein